MLPRVLLITALSKPWDNGWYYRKGFERNGCEITCYDPAGRKDPAGEALSLALEFRPDIVVHTKNELPAEVFQDLRKHARVIHWYPDPVIPDWLPAYVTASDIFLTMSEGLIGEFRKYNPMTFWLSQAFEPFYFETGEITPEDLRTFGADVAFVGNLGSKSQYLSRRTYLERVIREGYRFKWWGPKIPRKLSTVAMLMGRLGRSYGGKFVWGADFAKVAQLSGIFLAFDSMPHIRKSMSARMYTAVGCGAFYMCQHVEGIEEALVPDREIVTFRSEGEMLEKIEYYLKNDDLRSKIAAAGQARVLRDHTYEVRIRQMLELISSVLGPFSGESVLK